MASDTVDLCDVLADYLGFAAVDPSCRIDQLIDDSLEFLDMVLELETHFKRTIKPERYGEIKTVEDLSRILFALPS